MTAEEQEAAAALEAAKALAKAKEIAASKSGGTKKEKKAPTSIMFGADGRQVAALPREIRIPTGLPEEAATLGDKERAAAEKRLRRQQWAQEGLASGRFDPVALATGLRPAYEEERANRRETGPRPSDEAVIAWATGDEIPSSARSVAGAALRGAGEVTSRMASLLGGGIYNAGQLATGGETASVGQLLNIPKELGAKRERENLVRLGLKNVTQEPGLYDQVTGGVKVLAGKVGKEIDKRGWKALGTVPVKAFAMMGEGTMIPQESVLNTAGMLPMNAAPALLGKAAGAVGATRLAKAANWAADKLILDAKLGEAASAAARAKTTLSVAEQGLKKAKKAKAGVAEATDAVRAAQASYDAAKATAKAVPFSQKASDAMRAGIQNFAVGAGENVAQAAIQSGVERGQVGFDELVPAAIMGGPLNAGSRFVSDALGGGTPRKADPEAPAAAPGARPISEDAPAFKVPEGFQYATKPSSVVTEAAPVDETALTAFRRTVGAGASRDPVTGAVVYGPDSKAALREAIVNGRKPKATQAEKDAGKAAEDLVNSHAQANPDNWAEEMQHATDMGERYSLGGGTQTFAHSPADALADMAPAKTAEPKPPTPQQQAKIKGHTAEYIKAGEDLTDASPDVLKKRARSNKWLFDNGMLPEDAHPAFHDLTKSKAEIDRISDAATLKRGEKVKLDKKAEQEADDIDAVIRGEAMLKVQLRDKAGARILDKAGTSALVEALEADARIDGGFRDQLVSHFGEDAVARLEAASRLPSNRHEYMKGALTGEDPLDLLQARDKAVADKAQNTAEAEAQANAEKLRREEAQKQKEQDEADKKAHDDAEKKRFSDEQDEILFRDDVEALARMQPAVRVDKKTGKTLPDNRTKKAIESGAKETSRLGMRLAKLLSESDTLPTLVASKLPAQFRSTFDDLMLSIQNMDGKNKSGMEAMATFLATHSTSLVGKFNPKPAVRPRPFVKKARPSQD